MPDDVSRDSDRDLVARCVAGDSLAWSGFVGRFGGAVASRIAHVYRTRVGRPATDDEIQEVSQVVFTSLFRHQARALRGFQWKCSLATYIGVVASTAALWRIRDEARKRTRHAVPLRLEALSEFPADGAPSPGEEVLQIESAREIHEAVQGLPRRDQLVVMMYFWEGVPPSRIARTLGTTPAYVWVILKRALEKLRKKLETPRS